MLCYQTGKLFRGPTVCSLPKTKEVTKPSEDEQQKKIWFVIKKNG